MNYFNEIVRNLAGSLRGKHLTKEEAKTLHAMIDQCS
jgi:hypothetical protein